MLVYVYDSEGRFIKETTKKELIEKVGISEARFNDCLNNSATKITKNAPQGGIMLSTVKLSSIKKYGRNNVYPLYAIKNGKKLKCYNSQEEVLRDGLKYDILRNVFLRTMNHPESKEGNCHWTNYIEGTKEYENFIQETMMIQKKKHSYLKKSSCKGKFSDGGVIYDFNPKTKKIVAEYRYGNVKELAKHFRIPENKLNKYDGQLPIYLKQYSKYLVPKTESIENLGTKAVQVTKL